MAGKPIVSTFDFQIKLLKISHDLEGLCTLIELQRQRDNIKFDQLLSVIDRILLDAILQLQNLQNSSISLTDKESNE